MAGKLRVPVSLLIVPSIFCGVFTIISGGVAVTQGPNAVWWPCGAFFAGLVLCGALRLLLPVDWIADKELQDIERAERLAAYEKELEDGLRDGTLDRTMRIRRWKDYGVMALVVALIVFRFLLRSERGMLGFNAPLPSGGSGASLGGTTLGSFHLLGRDWTGVEMLLIVPLLGWLLWTLKAGFSTLRKAQKRD